MILILPLLLSLFFTTLNKNKLNEKLITIYILILSIITLYILENENLLFLCILIILLYWYISTNIDNIYIFVILLTIGSIFIFHSNSLYSYFLSVEYISFIILVYINIYIQDKYPGILYYLFSGIFSSIFILSCGYLSLGYYISYTLITLVFMWKLNLVPFHFLIPSIYNNLSPKLILFIDIPSKLLLFYIFYRILLSIPINLFFIIILTISIGIIAALIDKNIINLLFYSSLINYGLILIIITMNNYNYFIFYTIFYSFIVLIFLFLIIFKYINFQHYLNFYYILFWSILIFNLIGIPPFMGFFIKLLPLYLLMSNHSYILTIIILILFIFLTFIYLNILISLLLSNNSNNKLLFHYNNSFVAHFISSLLIILSFPFFLI